MSRLAIDWVYDHRWAITPNALETILQIVSSENYMARMDARYEENFKVFHGVDAGTLMTIQSMQGEPLPGAARATLRSNVAVIPVLGPIFPRSSLCTLSGATSVESIAKDLRVALDSPAVDSIVLNIDSPGGEITGISELSDMIFAAQEKKRVLSYVYGMGASAAYWIGSSASELLLAPTAEVGSIGVVAPYRDERERDAKNGIKNIEIVSSVSPNKCPDVNTAEGRAQIQRIVDELADIFVAAVARNRGTDTGDVLKNFGKGGMLVGIKAVEAGMADAVSSLEAVIAAENDKGSTSFTGGLFMRLSAEQVKAEHPEAYKAIFDAGVASVQVNLQQVETARAEGANAERERIRGIATLDAPGYEALVRNEMFKPEATASTVAQMVLAAQAETRKKTGVNQQADGTDLAGKLSGLGQQQVGGQDDKAAEEAAVKAIAAGANDSVKVKVFR